MSGVAVSGAGWSMDRGPGTKPAGLLQVERAETTRTPINNILTIIEIPFNYSFGLEYTIRFAWFHCSGL